MGSCHGRKVRAGISYNETCNIKVQTFKTFLESVAILGIVVVSAQISSLLVELREKTISESRTHGPRAKKRVMTGGQHLSSAPLSLRKLQSTMEIYLGNLSCKKLICYLLKTRGASASSVSMCLLNISIRINYVLTKSLHRVHS